MNNINSLNKDNILERKEFHRLPRKIQRELMEYWRETYPTNMIKERMGYASATAFYNLLKRLKLPTNVARIRIEDDYETEETETRPDTDISSIIEKIYKNDATDIKIKVSLEGEINLKDLPDLVLQTHEKGFELKIQETFEEVTQPLFYRG